MAGRGRKKQSFKSDNIKWKVGIYTRRSFDDTEDQESNTITNQKDMITSYVTELQNCEIVNYYVDDGFTGTDFNRPGFKSLFKDIVNGQVNMIVVKDLSRLGRNYTEVGNYIGTIFPLYNVRFISINDNIDSWKNPESVNSLIVPIKNLINDEYSKDISIKVKSAYKTMAMSGKFVSGTTPYGYMLDENDKHHLIINKEEADIVKQIFNMAEEGKGKIKITKYLNDNGILCRKELQRRIKHDLSLEPFAIESRYMWGTTTVSRILRNETYLGHLVQCKTTSISYKNHKIIDKDKDEWIKVENVHEPIIELSQFKKVQKVIENNTYKRSETKSESKYNKILKCADCGKAMLKQEDHRGNRNLSAYFCKSYLHLGKSCTQHKIKTEKLDNAVLEAIKQQVRLIVELDKALIKFDYKNKLELLEQNYISARNNINNEIERIKESKRKYYENLKFEKITKEEYLNLSKELDAKNNTLNNNLSLLEENHKENLKNKSRDDSWIEHYKRNRKIKKVTKKVINELIDKILIHEDNRITIIFKYRNEYEELLLFLKKEGNCNV